MTPTTTRTKTIIHYAAGCLSAIVLAGLFGSVTAHAALGSWPLSGADRHVAATMKFATNLTAFAQAPGAVTTAGSFTMNVVTLDSGTTVREYVGNATNQVFAVVWSGPAMPDLRQILGTSFDTYAAAAPGTAGLRLSGVAERSYTTNGLVVRSHGMKGHFQGYAYLPAAFPAGVTLGVLREATQP